MIWVVLGIITLGLCIMDMIIMVGHQQVFSEIVFGITADTILALGIARGRH